MKAFFFLSLTLFARQFRLEDAGGAASSSSTSSSTTSSSRVEEALAALRRPMALGSGLNPTTASSSGSVVLGRAASPKSPVIPTISLTGESARGQGKEVRAVASVDVVA